MTIAQRLLGLLGAMVLTVLYSPGEPFPDVPGLTFPVRRAPWISLDARTIDPEDAVDLRAIADEHYVSQVISVRFNADARAVRLIEVVDSHLLKLETHRGIETVALWGVQGTHPSFPDEVNAYLRATAVPRVEEFLRQGELVEHSWLLNVLVGEDVVSHDGYRLVQLTRASSLGLPQDISAEILLRGWGVFGHSVLDDPRLFTRTILASPHENARGVRVLKSWRDERERALDSAAQVLALTNQELTERAHAVQLQMAQMLGWTPEMQLEVRWIQPDQLLEKFLQLAQEQQDSPAPLPQARHDQMTEHVERVAAWSPEGPVIYVVQRPGGHASTLEQLDESLAHEIAHQYQEERLDAPISSMMSPYEGHAGVLTQGWLDTHTKDGGQHIAHAHELLEFRTLMELLDATADEAFRYLTTDNPFQVALPLALRMGLAAFWTDVSAKRPITELLPDGDSQSLHLSNPSKRPLVGLITGRFYLFPERESEPFPTPVQLGFSTYCLPFHVYLPPGGSLQVQLNKPVDEWRPDMRVRAVWSATPSLVEFPQGVVGPEF